MSHKVRDLDYINPRHKLPSCALPPEIRVKLGLAPAIPEKDKSSLQLTQSLSLTTIREKPNRAGQSKEVYLGTANVAQVASHGSAGAGTNWSNPNGHAFVRRGTSEQRLAEMREAAKQKRMLLGSRSSFSRGL
eukprot:TRINITY_DN95273_c0_g1_i1.p1 TRINITY_DN95273_c0_g1~~TRINITY_DN95273_c0_g1_i1.p1  ORF type:complete len:154 (-),score=25.14 TRINITY_DN95273_c0_g1_i1:47-445(-)